MRRRFHQQLALCGCLVALSGCVQATRHSNTMLFGTNTTFGIKAGATTGQTPEVVVGYDRQEAVIMPLVANTAAEEGKNLLVPCDLEGATVPGEQVHPCSMVGVSKGPGGTFIQDSYSVLASFGAQFGGSVGADGQKASGGLAQYFATGVAAQILAATGGAAVVATGPSATEASKSAGKTSAGGLTADRQGAMNITNWRSQTSFNDALAAKIKVTPSGELIGRLKAFEDRASITTTATTMCTGISPDQCADRITQRDFYADDYLARSAKLEESLANW